MYFVSENQIVSLFYKRGHVCIKESLFYKSGQVCVLEADWSQRERVKVIDENDMAGRVV